MSFSRLAVFAALLSGAASAADIPPLGLPILCMVGEDCFVQKYVDVDGSDKIVDFACGSLSSDGHKGTDFRVLPGANAKVLAALDGTVKAVRDGMEDNRFSDPQPVPSNRACGNAVLLDHGNGIETAYCHMTPGSLNVAVGDVVRKGDVLGRVGASGLADFRHVHFQVTANGTASDPFTGHPQGSAACGVEGTPLWDAAAREALKENPRTAILAAGFAGAPVTIEEIQDLGLEDSLGRDAAAIVAYGLVFGAEANDRHQLTLTGPGIELDEEMPQERNQAQSMRFAGKRRPDGLAPGIYKMRYAIVREGAVIDEMERTITVE
ncbi:MAG: M23 family metallopeptidase [Pseudomonadota bacterium]